MRRSFFILGVLFVFSACKKTDETEIKGTVIEKKGCYPDSYLVEITDAGDMEKAFSCDGSVPVQSTYNCKNAVFMHLSGPLATTGKKIRFVYAGDEVSCLSSTGTPNHIIVKSVRAD